MRELTLGEIRSFFDEPIDMPAEEIPAEFFAGWLGPRMKYSCSLWPAADLAAADEAMLALVCERAGVNDGMTVVDAGAGWGALTFWIAERYPRCRVHALTRSLAQASFLRNRARVLDARNVAIVHGDARMAEFEGIDRVFAIEMIEHVRNPEALLERMRGWLAPGGRVFIQAIAHKERATRLALPWFGRAVALSDSLLDAFDSGLETIDRWAIDGTQYARTIAAWRARLRGTSRRDRRWRGFLIACEEMFGWEEGRTFGVIQRLFGPKARI